MILLIIAVVGGLVLLTLAADQFVLGAARISATLRVSPVLIGAVVVGFGTSAPELLLSGLAAGRGALDIAVGNVVGSNIANLTLVLGIAALVRPPTVASSTLRREAPLSVGAVVVLAVMVQRGLGTAEGFLLLGGLVVFLLLTIRGGLSDDEILADQVGEYLDSEHVHPLPAELTRTLLGLLGTLAGAQALLYGAQGMATEFGLAEGFVGLTLVAVGTSLPELVTGVQAARRDEADLLVGNLLGSNAFNSFAVAGTAGVIGPGDFTDPDIAGVATLAMLLIAGAAWLFMRTKRKVERWEGALLLIAYAGLVVSLQT